MNMNLQHVLYRKVDVMRDNQQCIKELIVNFNAKKTFHFYKIRSSFTSKLYL